MKLKVALCCALIVLTGCTTSSTGRNRITLFSADNMNKMGATSFEELKKKEKINHNKAINNYVNCVANAIIKHVPKSAHQGSWEVVVFDSKQVNAFALPGGKIGVYTAILDVAKTPAQLAAIIGHEVAHVLEEHSNERLSSNQLTQTGLALVNTALESQNIQQRNAIMSGLGLGVQYGIILPYGRSHESEADIVGQDLMAVSGFNPKASIALWQNMAKLNNGQQPPEFMSTHPSHESRINELTRNLAVSEPMYRAAKVKPVCKRP